MFGFAGMILFEQKQTVIAFFHTCLVYWSALILLALGLSSQPLILMVEQRRMSCGNSKTALCHRNTLCS